MARSPEAGDPVVTVAEMVAAEQRIFDSGITVNALMHRAGTGAAELIWRIGARTPTLVLCGPGNNGGDGYVIAEFLRRKGVPVRAAAAKEPGTDAARNARAAYGGPVEALDAAQPAAQFVDCLFGSGLSRPIHQPLWGSFLRLFEGAKRRFAIDLPSGIDSDRAEPLNAVPRFDHCIALGAWKYAHLLRPAVDVMGALSLVDIGARFEGHRVHRLARPRIAAPGPGDHKYKRGLVAILAGAMPGAAILAAMAAQGAGAGYVKILSADERPAALPADIVWTRHGGGDELAEALDDPRIGALLVGPGLGRDDTAEGLLDAALASDAPLVLDADALLRLPDRRSALNKRERPGIATPHDGEFAAMGQGIDLPEGNKAERALAMAGAYGVGVIHKGADSVMALPDGGAWIADGASPWLSVAGSGDVLAGALAARLAATGDVEAAIRQAQWLHGRAARLAGPAFGAAGLAGHLAPALAECL